ncbi:hypothetical protein B0H14DRAFT_3159089 [Mycena olivaceomarginata]|nr:hypothetical protein B0H14DRAFT_3159089 [Mycena olivaceomarginata]
MALALSTGPRSNRRLNGMGGKGGGSAATAVQKECSTACMLSTSCAPSCTWAWASVQDDDRDGGNTSSRGVVQTAEEGASLPRTATACDIYLQQRHKKTSAVKDGRVVLRSEITNKLRRRRRRDRWRRVT